MIECKPFHTFPQTAHYGIAEVVCLTEYPSCYYDYATADIGCIMEPYFQADCCANFN